LNSTDLLVVPSLMKDPFPTTVLEGMSCNKAVIATNTGGAVEAIENGVSGILIESTDSRNFAKSMDFLIENKEIRMKYGNQARKRYLADFTVHSFENRLEIFFKSI
jgi:glycosyltransferase involved in cell wall biosynthesis